MNRRTILLVVVALLLLTVACVVRWMESERNYEQFARNDRFSVRLDAQIADGSLFRADVESTIFRNEVRIYLSPLSFRRLAGKSSPTATDVRWFALTDLVSGRRVTYGNPFQDPPDDIPPHETIQVLTFEETPFFFHDQQPDSSSEGT